MIRRLVLASSVLAVLFAAVPGLSQAKKAFGEPGTRPPEGIAQRRFDADTWLKMLDRHLDLTPRQEAAIKPILEKSIARSKEVAQNKDLQPEQKRAKMQAIRAETNAAIRKHLTQEQQQKFDQMGKMRIRPKERPGGPEKLPGNKPKEKGAGKGA